MQDVSEDAAGGEEEAMKERCDVWGCGRWATHLVKTGLAWVGGVAHLCCRHARDYEDGCNHGR